MISRHCQHEQMRRDIATASYRKMASSTAWRASTLTERLEFFSMPEPNSGCSLWLGSMVDCYGVLRFKGKAYKAHRAAWMAYRGPIPFGMCVCHRCDNPGCVNPDHLFLGTHTENMHDMLRKGRRFVTRGETVPNARLTEAQVLEIRNDSRIARVIGAAYGVSRSLVSAIKTRVAWRHLP